MRLRLWTYCLVMLGTSALVGSGLWRFRSASWEGSITPAAQKEIDQVMTRIDRTEVDALAQLNSGKLDRSEQITLLGKLIYFDKNLSVNRNEACVFCHMPEAGFTGGVSALNATTGSYPGSVRTRFSNRKPMSHMYATYAPALHYNQLQGDLVGGTFGTCARRVSA